ncbi:RNA-directed DNA polymerase from mobile element jockey [Eumeta japonica]|uniref:RNA-directed DNA polymerase from mobile element jockey n=1 Tax=Eumeta variegata TaxID=151549 RepID=A0A4C1YLA4_EUMVA|nr:RNA-directed DNA polymerase from mobile element jockey [Eumeta japonica]
MAAGGDEFRPAPPPKINPWNKFPTRVTSEQQVRLDNTYSSMRPIKAGVPQGSTLSRLLYSAYVNDIPRPSTGVQLALFADDTAFYLRSNSIVNIPPRHLGHQSGALAAPPGVPSEVSSPYCKHHVTSYAEPFRCIVAVVLRPPHVKLVLKYRSRNIHAVHRFTHTAGNPFYEFTGYSFRKSNRGPRATRAASCVHRAFICRLSGPRRPPVLPARRDDVRENGLYKNMLCNPLMMCTPSPKPVFSNNVSEAVTSVDSSPPARMHWVRARMNRAVNLCHFKLHVPRCKCTPSDYLEVSPRRAAGTGGALPPAQLSRRRWLRHSAVHPPQSVREQTVYRIHCVVLDCT